MTDAKPRWMTYLELLDDYEQNNGSGLPHLSELLGRDLEGRENELWRETLNQLAADDLIIAHDGTGAASVSAQFTAKGRQKLAQVKARRADHVVRKSVAANGLLRWLHDRDPYGAEWQYIENIAGTDFALLEGEELPVDLFGRAAIRLKGLGLVRTGLHVIETEVPLQARLTDAGQELVESGRTLEEHMEGQRQPQGGFVTNIFGGVHDSQVAWGAQRIDQSVQTTNSGVAADELVNLVRAVVAALPVMDLSEEASLEVTTSAQALEGELVRQDQNQELVRTYFQRIKDTIVTEAGGALGQVLAAHIKLFMAGLGVPLS